MNRERGSIESWGIMWGSEGDTKRYLESEAISYHFLPNTLIPPSSQGAVSPEFISFENTPYHVELWSGKDDLGFSGSIRSSYHLNGCT